MFSQDSSNDWTSGNYPLEHILPWVIFAVVVIGVIYFLIKRIESQCPACSKPWRKFIYKEKLDEKLELVNETHQTGRVDANGLAITVPVKIPYLKTKYNYFWNCENCGNKWSTVGTETRKA